MKTGNAEDQESTDCVKEDSKSESLKKEVITQNTEIGSCDQNTRELCEFNFSDVASIHSQNSMNYFFTNQDSSQRKYFFDFSAPGSIQKKYCELCSNNILIHECGLKYDKDYLIGYISTLINIGNKFQEVGCMCCSRSLGIDTYNCVIHNFL